MRAGDEEMADVSGGTTRRRVLQVVGAGSMVGLAGCLHDDEPCDLSVRKEHIGGPVSYGDTTEFEITVCNEGDETCESTVTVTDDLPSGTTFATDSGSGWNCTESGGVVTCEHPNSSGLDGGDCLPTLTLAVDIGTVDEVGSEIANCVTVDQGDADLGHKQDCVKVPIEPSAGECDLAVTKSYDGDVILSGSSATFQVEVCNEGDGPCDDPVTVVDGLPSGVTFDSGSGTGWSCSQSSGSVVCTHSNSGGLAPGECLPVLDLTVTIGSMSQTGDQVRNCAALKVDDANASNDRDCVSVPVRPGEGKCDLAVTKSYGGDVVTAGTSTAFEIEVCNVGDGSCDDPVTVVDGLPSGVAFDSESGTGWNCTESGGTVTCTHSNSGGLAPGECLPVLELNVTVGSINETGDQIRNCVSIEGSDADTSNNRDCVSVPVQPGTGECDLSVTKSHTDGGLVTAGESTTFDIVVCNAGDGPCDDPVTVTDDLPSGVSFASGTGSGWTVSESGGIVTATHSNTGGLAESDCLPVLTLEVDVGSIDETGDQLRNCARVDSDDATADNNTDCTTVTVTQAIEGCNGLVIDKVAASQFTYGEQETYEITVCNPTDQQCDGQITVTDDLPGGMSFVSASGSGWSASASGGVVTATHPNNGNLAPGGCLPTLTLTVELVAAEQFPGGSDAVQNCAELIADGAIVDESCVTHVIWNV
ncbi:hypothetical protein [Salinibaculum salinum]|uniref:hypothetical protein n=1 Tax=Salinibaculum salinum TaxID=3131996 RepID=UPI0030EF7D58